MYPSKDHNLIFKCMNLKDRDIQLFKYVCAHMSLGLQFPLSPGYFQCLSHTEHLLFSNPAIMFLAYARMPVILVYLKNSPVLLKTNSLAEHRTTVWNPSTQEAELRMIRDSKSDWVTWNSLTKSGKARVEERKVLWWLYWLPAWQKSWIAWKMGPPTLAWGGWPWLCSRDKTCPLLVVPFPTSDTGHYM